MESLIENIRKQNFIDAEKQYHKMTFTEFKKDIEISSFESPNLLYYKFLEYLLRKQESEQLHSFASEILATSLCHFEDSYSKALYHAKKALVFNENLIQNLEWLLFFYDIPDKLLSKQDAKSIIVDILKRDKSNETALKFMKRNFSQEEQVKIKNEVVSPN